MPRAFPPGASWNPPWWIHGPRSIRHVTDGQAIVDALTAAALGPGDRPGRDDLAILALRALPG